MNNRSSNINDLPLDIFQNLIPLFTENELNKNSNVSTFWFTTFTSEASWKQRIESRFKIPGSVLIEFKKYVYHVMDADTFSYKFLYDQLIKLNNVAHRLPNYLKYSYFKPEYYFQVLACCFNNVECAKSIIPRYEDFQWIVLSIYAGFNEVVKLADLNKIEQVTRAYFQTAIKSGNKVFLKNIIQQIEAEEIFFSEEHVNIAALSGDFQFFKWVLDNTDPEATYEADENTMANACKGGNLQIIQFFIREYGLSIDTEDLSYLMMSGSYEAVNWFLKAYQFKLNDGYLVDAAKSGNLKLVKALCNIGLEEDWETRRYAAGSGSIELYQYLLKLTCPEIFPLLKELKRREIAQESFDNLIDKVDEVYSDLVGDEKYAASSGNVDLLYYCESELLLKIDNDIFVEAIRSGNVLLVKSLKERFHWNVTEHQQNFGASGNFSMILWCSFTFAVEEYLRRLLSGTQQKTDKKPNKDELTLAAPLLLNGFVDAILNPDSSGLKDSHYPIIVQGILDIIKDKQFGLVEYHQTKKLLTKVSEALKDNFPELSAKCEEMISNVELIGVKAKAGLSFLGQGSCC